MEHEPRPHLPEKQGGIAAAEQGQVLLDGPNGVAVAMTPGAAQETGRSLLSAADEANEQLDAPQAHPS